MSVLVKTDWVGHFCGFVGVTLTSTSLEIT